MVNSSNVVITHVNEEYMIVYSPHTALAETCAACPHWRARRGHRMFAPMRHVHLHILLIGLCAIAPTALPSCSKPAPQKDGTDIRGRVTGRLDAPERMRTQRLIGFLKVEGGGESSRYDCAAVTITDTTAISIVDGGARRTGSFAAIRLGDSVEATFTGAVLESYPPQATARTLVVIPRR